LRANLVILPSLVVLAAAVVTANGAQRQRASPHETVSASVDGAELTIAYGRPYTRGREIFGALVPYGRVWCPGADEATTLSTNRPLQLSGLSLPAQRYTLWILPTADTWKLVVSRRTGQWHTQYNDADDLGRVDLEKRALTSPVEQLTFSIDKNPSGGGTIKFQWAATEASAPFTVLQ
jgi:hypothetical protein